MSDLISTLRARTQESNARNEDLRTRLKSFESRLQEAAGESNLTGNSEPCTLQVYGDDDSYYGYLTFHGALQIAYRTTEDDLSDHYKEVERTYSVKDIDDCDPVWLRALAVPKVMDSLAASLISSVDTSIADTVRGAQTVDEAANLPLQQLSGGLIDAATRLSFGDVIEQWKEAQSALVTNPIDATTRASSLIETLCKHILHMEHIPLPSSETIQPLFAAASRSLTLGPEQQSTNDLRDIMQAMKSLVAAIGALRTHAGTAHGRGPGHQPISLRGARMAVNTAGVLATFLMDSLLAQSQNPQATTPPIL